uniref:Cytochrome b5 heme-binding domain-containing protein n=1 Tax=Palpitomonas bilix TaxID=652834 RepID=A0A7S3D753_9EUKA
MDFATIVDAEIINVGGISITGRLVLTSLIGLLAIFFLTRRKSSSNDSSKTTKDKSKKIFTRNEVAKHNKKDDCWLIYKNRVFDVTSYVPEHKGGDTILKNAGRDSTDGVDGPQHPLFVVELLEEFYIGDLAK